LKLFYRQYALLFLHLHFNKGTIVNPKYQRAMMALALFAGINLSATAGVWKQADVTPAARPGSSALVRTDAGTPVTVVPMPAQLPPLELQPQPLPQPLPAAMDEPATVPEPGTLTTLAAGLVLMGALARRRRS
jgi:hypothetical protein